MECTERFVIQIWLPKISHLHVIINPAQNSSLLQFYRGPRSVLLLVQLLIISRDGVSIISPYRGRRKDLELFGQGPPKS